MLRCVLFEFSASLSIGARRSADYEVNVEWLTSL